MKTDARGDKLFWRGMEEVVSALDPVSWLQQRQVKKGEKA